VPKIVEQIKSQLSQYSFLSATKLVPDEAELSHFSEDQLVGIEPDLRVVIQVSSRLFDPRLFPMIIIFFFFVIDSMNILYFSWMCK
jgi:hypothetical protein